MNIYVNLYLILLKTIGLFREKEYLLFINLSHINFGRDSSIPRKFLGLFPFHFKKKYLNRINILNILSNNLKHNDLMGRSLINLNIVIFKFNITMSLIKESIYIIRKYYNFYNYSIKKKMNVFLFHIKPKSFFFIPSNFIMFDKNKYKNFNLIKTKSSYVDIFNLNQFKHSGVFEAV